MLKDKKVSELTIPELLQLFEEKKEQIKKEGRALLEQEFVKAQNEARKLLNEKVDQARMIISEAEKISEQYGIPFDYSGQRYTPESFFEKYKLLVEDYDFLNDNADILPDEYSGWMSSSSRC